MSPIRERSREGSDTSARRIPAGRLIGTRCAPAYDPGMLAIAFVVASVVLSPPFGPAEASAVDDTDGLTIEIQVAVSGPWEAVLARPFSSFEELAPTALVDRGDGTWGALVRLPTAEDWSLVFDAIDPEGEAIRSDTASLTELGVDPVVVAGPPDGALPSEPVPASTWWLVAGIALAFAALGALAWWTFASDGAAASPGGETVDGGGDADE